MAAIDRLESVGKPGNYRILIQVEPLDPPPAGPAYTAADAYVKSRVQASPVHTDWLEIYDDRRFVPFAQRG